MFDSRTDSARGSGLPPPHESTWTWWRTMQVVAALWLLASPVAYPSPEMLVVAKDLLAGGALLLATLAAALDRRVRRWEGLVCAGIGVLLIVATFALDHGPGTGSVLSQWNEVVAGVVVVYLGAARVR